VFVVFFGIILVIQFIGMLFHRFGTLSHILASVELTLCSPKVEDISGDAFLNKHAVQIAKDLQRLKGIDEDNTSDDSIYANRIDKRKTIQNLEKRRLQQHKIGTLDVAFRKRFMNISSNIAEGTPVLGGIRKKETLTALEKRRANLMDGECDGKMMTLGVKNEFVRNKRGRSTLDTKSRNSILNTNGGVQNGSYMDGSDEEEMIGDDRQIQMQMYSPNSRNSGHSGSRHQNQHL